MINKDTGGPEATGSVPPSGANTFRADIQSPTTASSPPNVVSHGGLEAESADLAIAGLVPLSSVDWPDHLVATVFCQGCPWRCPYCQNAAILEPSVPGIVPWDEVRALLDKRRGLLDGVVFTGGEALRQAAVVSAMREVKERGLAVGLHSAGAYPRRLVEVLAHIDWVGLDIKALPQDYREAVGFDAGAKAWAALDAVLRESERRPTFDFEVRTTIFPGSSADRDFSEILKRLRAAGVANFAVQEARTQGTDPIFQAMAQRWDMPAWRARWEEISAEVREAGFARVEVR